MSVSNCSAPPHPLLGFLLDGGVHSAAILRTVLPTPPSTIISTASLHRAHLPPHDTVLALALPPPTSTTSPHGPATSVQSIRSASQMPVAPGQSSPSGQILLTFGLPDTPENTRPPQGLTITCLNAIVEITNEARVWTLRVTPARGSEAKPVKETRKASGVEAEVGMFARAVKAKKEGKEVDKKEELGSPRGAMWDVAVVEACLTSNGERVELEKLVAGK